MRIHQLVRKLGLCVLTCLAGGAVGHLESTFPWSVLKGEWVQVYSTRYLQSTYEIDWHCVRAVISVDELSSHGKRDKAVNITFSASLHNIASEPIRTEWIISGNATHQNEWEFIAPLQISRMVEASKQRHQLQVKLASHAPITACRCVLEQSFAGPSFPVLILMPNDNYSLSVLLPRKVMAQTSFSPELFLTFLQTFAKRFHYVGYDRQLLSSYDVANCSSL